MYVDSSVSDSKEGEDDGEKMIAIFRTIFFRTIFRTLSYS